MKASERFYDISKTSLMYKSFELEEWTKHQTVLYMLTFVQKNGDGKE
jgi:hypothetical protein